MDFKYFIKNKKWRRFIELSLLKFVLLPVNNNIVSGFCKSDDVWMAVDQLQNRFCPLNGRTFGHAGWGYEHTQTSGRAQ